MAKWKDWKPGEYRVKIEVVLESGSCLQYYLPHVSKEMGREVLELAGRMVSSPVKTRKSNEEAK